MEVIDGAPPAEFGDKTSVVIVATTRSGLGETTAAWRCDGFLRNLWDCERWIRSRVRRKELG